MVHLQDSNISETTIEIPPTPKKTSTPFTFGHRTASENGAKSTLEVIISIVYIYTIIYFLMRIKDLIGFNFGSWVPNNPYKSG